MIHYHGMPMTPTSTMIKAMRGRHAMVSFEHPQQIEMVAETCSSFVLDNGTFTDDDPLYAAPSDDPYAAARRAITNVAAQVGANDKPTWS